MDSEMEGIFWIVVLGIGLVLGGMALMKSVHLSDWLIAAFMILSSTAFMTYFGLGLWQVRRLARSLKDAKGASQMGQLDTSELSPGKKLTIQRASTERYRKHYADIGACIDRKKFDGGFRGQAAVNFRPALN